MTVDQLNELSEEEHEAIVTSYKEFDWTKLDSLDLLSVSRWEALRFEERKSKPNITWPEKLSKKEIILCKLSLMENAMNFHKTIVSDKSWITYISTLIKDIKQHAYKNSSSFLIDKRSAILLNGIYESLCKCFFNI